MAMRVRRGMGWVWLCVSYCKGMNVHGNDYTTLGVEKQRRKKKYIMIALAGEEVYHNVRQCKVDVSYNDNK